MLITKIKQKLIQVKPKKKVHLFKNLLKTLKKETELKEVYKTLENKSDIIIKLQNTSQEKTNQIVAIQNKLQEKTELTIELNKKLLENQIKINSDYEKELNPLFPMSISIEIELPFSNYIFSKEYINKIYSLKNEIQNGGDYNKTDITIQWKDNKKEVFQLDYNNASKLPEHNILSLFFNERPFSIRLQRNHGGIFDDFNNKKEQTVNEKLIKVRETFDNYPLIPALHSFMSDQESKYKNLLPPLTLLSEEKKQELLSKLKELDFLPKKNIAA